MFRVRLLLTSLFWFLPYASVASSPASDRPEATLVPLQGVEQPMGLAGSAPTIQARISGEGPFVFAIDTGSAGAIRVSRDLAQRLGLQQRGEVVANDPSGMNPQILQLVEVPVFEIGGARFRGLIASQRDFERRPGEEVDGVIGLGLFAETLLILDYPGRRVRMENGALPAPDGRTVLALESEDGIPAIRVSAAGREYRVHLDSGAPGGLILPTGEAARLRLVEPPRVVGRGRTAHNEFEISAAPLAGDLLLGEWRFPRPMIEFQPILPFPHLGAQILRDLVVTFDARQQRVRVVRP